MAYDYSDDIAGALESITEFGRIVSFLKFKSSPLDPSDPLAGPGDPTIDITLSDIPAAFVEPAGTVRLGSAVDREGLWKSSTKIALVAADSVNDYAAFDILRDTDGSDWKIQTVQVFQPGPVPVLYYVGLAR